RRPGDDGNEQAGEDVCDVEIERHRLSHVERAAAGELDDARGLVVLGREAGGGKLEAARAFGIAVVAPLGVRLAVGGQCALSALVGLLEAVRVNQRQILLGYAKQELQAI